ncbi:TolC family outer membrane protein [Marinobacter zhejiangensis]|uniref:Outer membrane protein n=1 Tax=Marinobacter zhejiangensis TaxID=488535 RepID=A0A1I4SBM7_9GAMM|nr:TolC family outer membrane protein [Marinobacter zhejiangensis]SFM61865.1 outer membrane protein [Marinobacter zhejiangensis]
MRKRLLTGFIGLLSAQPALSLDLIETYEKALSYDSGIAAARASYEAQQASVDISQSSLLPQIFAFGDVDYTDQDGPAIDNGARTLSYGVQLTQPLFRADDWYQYDASKYQSESARAQYNLAQQRLMLDVATAYFNVLRAADNLTTTQAAEKAFQRQYEQSQERFDVGLIAITDVYESRAGYDAAKSVRIAAENNLDIARERLARLTGEYSEQVDNLKQDFPLSHPDPQDPSAWVDTALEQNWNVQSAQFDLQTSEANLSTAKSGHYPTLDLNASYGEADVDGAFVASNDGTTTEGSISLTLTVPIYTGGGTQASVRQQRSLMDATQQTLETVRRDVSVTTRSLYLTVNNNIESASSLYQTIISRRSALDATRAGYEVGTRNIVEVLDAERNYYESLRDYSNARYDYVINTLTLKLSAGILSPQDLMDLNNWVSAAAPGIEAMANEAENAATTR